MNLVLLLIGLLAANVSAQTTVVASSKLQACVAEGSTAAGSLSCEQQLVVTLAVGATALATSALKFSVPCVGSTDGICPCTCNYAKDSKCKCRDIVSPINVTLTKSPVYATFPLTYEKLFNAQAREEFVVTKYGTCKDEATQMTPTCGWVMDDYGKQTLDSQGFCCMCSFSDTGLGSVTSVKLPRSGSACNLLGPSASRGAASCLRFSNSWYSGYTIESGRLDFAISVAASTSTAAGKTTTQVVSLGPSTPVALSSQGGVSATLLGDMASYAAWPDVTGKWLMIPTPLGQPPEEAFSQNSTGWMVLDRSLVTITGTECDKVGVSFVAFRNQLNACSRPRNTCLANQLVDLYQDDLARIDGGLTPKYLITRYGGGGLAEKQAYYKEDSNNSQVILALPMVETSNSLVVLSLAADDLKLVTNRSPGSINSAKVCSFANVTCGAFEALSDKGYLMVAIQNDGFIPASYYVTVSQCTQGVAPIPAQSVSLAAQAQQQLTFQIIMTTSNAVNASCSLALYDSQNGVADSKVITFLADATYYKRPDQLQGTEAGAASVNKTRPTKGSAAVKPPQLQQSLCSTLCTSMWKISCILINRCWSKFISLLAFVLGMSLLLALFAAGIWRGWFVGCIELCAVKVFGMKRKAVPVTTTATDKLGETMAMMMATQTAMMMGSHMGNTMSAPRMPGMTGKLNSYDAMDSWENDEAPTAKAATPIAKTAGHSISCGNDDGPVTEIVARTVAESKKPKESGASKLKAAVSSGGNAVLHMLRGRGPPKRSSSQHYEKLVVGSSTSSGNAAASYVSDNPRDDQSSGCRTPVEEEADDSYSEKHLLRPRQQPKINASSVGTDSDITSSPTASCIMPRVFGTASPAPLLPISRPPSLHPSILRQSSIPRESSYVQKPQRSTTEDQAADNVSTKDTPTTGLHSAERPVTRSTLREKYGQNDK